MVNLKCVRCEIEMRETEFSGVVIDICDKCGGIWFDGDEFKTVKSTLEQTKDSELISDDAIKSGKALSCDPELKCPRCKDIYMKKFKYMYDSDITIDACEACNGLWLDGGELSRIIEYLNKSQEVEEAELEKARKLAQQGYQKAMEARAAADRGLARNALVRWVYKLLDKSWEKLGKRRIIGEDVEYK